MWQLLSVRSPSQIAVHTRGPIKSALFVVVISAACKNDSLSGHRHSQFVEISGHLIDLSVVMILDLLEEAGVLGKHKVDGSSLTTETTSAADSMDVVLLLHRELVVDNETDLLDIDTSGKQVSGDENTDGTGSELLHHDFTLLLVHLSVH